MMKKNSLVILMASFAVLFLVSCRCTASKKKTNQGEDGGPSPKTSDCIEATPEDMQILPDSSVTSLCTFLYTNVPATPAVSFQATDQIVSTVPSLTPVIDGASTFAPIYDASDQETVYPTQRDKVEPTPKKKQASPDTAIASSAVPSSVNMGVTPTPSESAMPDLDIFWTPMLTPTGTGVVTPVHTPQPSPQVTGYSEKQPTQEDSNQNNPFDYEGELYYFPED